ncbi:tetratricopeptide repeat protein [Planococcus salinarum]|uniref:tetratricopeptide repeat protein n=1 Tax=Planococcus salinarum TaxID=622695 RepID=UPI000E3E188E|nr:tetratricopeptide repeat protein [Planococcus salinarum]TAA73074.1 tetratricopeptide repeat protein [Planococcus salinarum]
MRANDIKTIEQLIEAIRSLWAERSIRRLREWLAELETEDDYYRLIRLADQAHLYKYSNLLATHADKRFGTLRPFAWNCIRLLETGKSLEAEERMTARLHGVAESNFTADERASAHMLLFRVFCQLNRMPEAKEQLEKIQEAKGSSWPDFEAFYYLHSGKWERAEEILRIALLDGTAERNDFVRSLLADHLSMTGRHSEALEMLRGGQAACPENWSFWMEQVIQLFHLGRYEETIRLMEDINVKNPYHDHRAAYVYLTAECLYKLEKWDELEAWTRQHQTVLEQTIYGKTAIQRGGIRKQLELTPKVQKLDYCVPASLSIMLEAFDMDIGQDEIAAHVFDVTGSKLRTTMMYMESLGLKGQYFKGTVELYKGMIDAGLPVLLSMLIENNAHVQVLVGYDDRLQCMLIQDPNEQIPFLVPYADMKEVYKMTDSLSMVFVKKQQLHILAELNEAEHRFFEQLYAFLEEEELESDAFIAFLEEHIEERYAAVIGISILFSDRAKALHGKWVERLRREFGPNDAAVSLLVAHMHYQKEELPEALAYLAAVNEKNSPYALFLRGVILLSQDSHAQAIPYFKASIELDHYQPAAYSYLATCYMEAGKIHQAYKWSLIAIRQMPTDIYAQITHGLIQYESGAYAKSLARFRKLSEEHPEDGYFIYEIGRCLLALGKEAEAISSFERYIEMAPALPYSYLRIAEIHMESENWPKALSIVNQGLDHADNKDILHIYRGHIAGEQEQFAKAEEEYRKALQLDPDDFLAVTFIAHSLVKQDRFAAAVALLEQYAAKGDADYFIHSSTMLWDEWPGYTGKEQAVALLEKGLDKKDLEDYKDMALQYADFGGHPLFRNRVLSRFKELRKTETDATLLCIEGQLHEEAGNAHFARMLYEEALEKEPNAQAHFQLGMLEVEADRLEGAIPHFIRSAELDPGNSAVGEALVKTYTALEDVPAAFAAALILLQHDPLVLDFKELFELAVTEESVQLVSKTLDAVADQVPEEWLLVGKAHCAEKEGRMEEAEDLFEQAKELKGAYPSYYQHTEFCVRRGQLKRAALLLEELIAERPEDERLYGEYVRIYAQMGKTHDINRRLKKLLKEEELGLAQAHCADELGKWFVETEEQAGLEHEQKNAIGKLLHAAQRIRVTTTVFILFGEARKRAPESEVPVLRHAAFCLDRGMPKEAIDGLEPFVKRTGNYEAASLQLVATIQLATEKESEKLLYKAISLAENLHKQQPADAAVLMLWGNTLAAMEATDEALAKYEHAIRLEPFNGEPYVRILEILSEERKEEVPALLARIPEELERNEWIRLARGMSLMTLGDAAAGHELITALTEEVPELSPAFYELARCEMMLGNKAEAIAALRELFSKDDGVMFVLAIGEEPLFEAIDEDIDELVEELV